MVDGPANQSPPPGKETYTGIGTENGIELFALPAGRHTVDSIYEALDRRVNTGEISNKRATAIAEFLGLIDKNYGKGLVLDQIAADPNDLVEAVDLERRSDDLPFLTKKPIAGGGEVVFLAFSPPHGHKPEIDPMRSVNPRRLSLEQWRATMIDLVEPEGIPPVIFPLDTTGGIDGLSLNDDAFDAVVSGKITEEQRKAISDVLAVAKRDRVTLDELQFKGRMVISERLNDGSVQAAFFFQDLEYEATKGVV